MLYEDPAGEEPSTYMAAVSKVREILSSESSSENLSQAAQQLFSDLYSTEIQKQLDMGRYKAAKKTPTCLEASVLEKGTALVAPTTTDNIWSNEESIAVLSHCLQKAIETPNN
mmetsp:Transcript_3948/g.6215  ORF Transcript_3948/g.6215 Transcript_3948/m.6215 type:complete len:113 (-) Transcript_3948:8-346(-)